MPLSLRRMTQKIGLRFCMCLMIVMFFSAIYLNYMSLTNSFEENLDEKTRTVNEKVTSGREKQMRKKMKEKKAEVPVAEKVIPESESSFQKRIEVKNLEEKTQTVNEKATSGKEKQMKEKKAEVPVSEKVIPESESSFQKRIEVKNLEEKTQTVNEKATSGKEKQMKEKKAEVPVSEKVIPESESSFQKRIEVKNLEEKTQTVNEKATSGKEKQMKEKKAEVPVVEKVIPESESSFQKRIEVKNLEEKTQTVNEKATSGKEKQMKEKKAEVPVSEKVIPESESSFQKRIEVKNLEEKTQTVNEKATSGKEKQMKEKKAEVPVGEKVIPESESSFQTRIEVKNLEEKTQTVNEKVTSGKEKQMKKKKAEVPVGEKVIPESESLFQKRIEVKNLEEKTQTVNGKMNRGWPKQMVLEKVKNKNPEVPIKEKLIPVKKPFQKYMKIEKSAEKYNETKNSMNYRKGKYMMKLEDNYKLNKINLVKGVLKDHYMSESMSCASLPVSERFDCLPTLFEATEEQCIKLGCCWNPVGSKKKGDSVENMISLIPSCYFPPDFTGYKVSEIEYKNNSLEAVLTRLIPSGLTRDIAKLKFAVTYYDATRLRIKITDYSASRYEVPLQLLNYSDSVENTSFYDVLLQKDGVFKVVRKSSKKEIFCTNLETLLYAEQLLQFSANLPSHFIFGLGDHMGPLLRSTNWTKYTFFNRDEIPKMNMNLYSSFPSYLVMEEDGNSHGVYLFNSNAMDVILQPAPAVTFRTTGGILDLFIFLGPSPSNVIQQFVGLIGLPVMPPYWSLGFHLCRLGYFTTNKTREVWQRTIDAGIPFDTQWNDIDYMDRYNDFTYDKANFSGLADFVKEVHERGMHYIMIIDPGISNAEPPGTYHPFDDGQSMNIFIKNASGQDITTKVWNKISSVFPDFTSPDVVEYWTNQMAAFHSIIPYDGVWLDMNEPTNFLNGSFYGCPDSSLEHPPYVPGNDPLCTKTLCMTAQHNVSSHYNVHNIYGLMQTKTTYRALIDIRKKRPFIVTRAGFPGIGHYSAMWNGDVISLWDHMRWTIPSILSFSMNGISMIGADICGFNDNTTVELCARWSALGAFYPFSRNHNSDENIEQDPVALGPTVVAAAKASLTTRYFLLPYLYTLLYKSHIYGDTVARPLFFEYPHDIQSYAIDKQFLWGPSLMILPVLDPGVNEVTGYFPRGIWYDFYTGEMRNSSGESYILAAPIEKINLAIHGGYILPAQMPSVTTTLSRKSKFVLLTALCSQDKAAGELYWDDGDSLDTDATKSYNYITFSVADNKFMSSVIHRGYETVMNLTSIQIYGVKKKPSNVMANGEHVNFDYVEEYKTLNIQNMKISLLEPLTVTWE